MYDIVERIALAEARKKHIELDKLNYSYTDLSPVLSKDECRAEYHIRSLAAYGVVDFGEVLAYKCRYKDLAFGIIYLLLYCILFISPMSIYTLLLLNIVIYQNEITNNYYKFFYSYTVIVFSSINIFFAFVLIFFIMVSEKKQKEKTKLISIVFLRCLFKFLFIFYTVYIENKL